VPGREKINTERKQIFFSPELWAQVNIAAKKRGLSASALVRSVVIDYLTSLEPKVNLETEVNPEPEVILEPEVNLEEKEK